MSAKYIAAVAAALALSGCAWQERTEETIVTKTITPGPGSTTQPSTTVTDTIVKTSGPKGAAPTSTATMVTTHTTTPVGSTSSTTSSVEGPFIHPGSYPQPVILDQDMRR